MTRAWKRDTEYVQNSLIRDKGTKKRERNCGNIKEMCPVADHSGLLLMFWKAYELMIK